MSVRALSLLPLLALSVAQAAHPHLLQGRPFQALPHRALYARQIPEPFTYQSSLYQNSPLAVQQQYPFVNYDAQFAQYPYGVQPVSAVVELKSDSGSNVAGNVLFVQPHPPNGPVFISGNITGLSPGKHGFHVHTYGDLREGCKGAGSHYNPYLTNHGGPVDPFRHVGDLGNIEVGEDGVATLQLSDHVIALAGAQSILGRSVVVHDKEDDLGRGGDQESLKTGNAGNRVACGVVALAETTPPPPPPSQPTAAPYPPAQE